VATYSTYLGLKLNSATDPFLLSDFIGNWTILDGSPGVFVCTSSSRPSWTAAQAGRLIFMTDWKALSYWTGTAWLDCRDAAPVFAGGVYLNTAIARGTTGTFTVINLTCPRTCSLAIALTGTYLVAASQNQDAGMTATSLQVVSGITAGAHTVGVAADIGTYSAPATIIGVKALAWIAATAVGNSL